jgi:hypothetical protein
MCQRAAFCASFSRILCFVVFFAGCGGRSVSGENPPLNGDAASTSVGTEAGGRNDVDGAPSNVQAGVDASPVDASGSDVGVIDASIVDSSLEAHVGMYVDATTPDASMPRPDAMACSQANCPQGCCNVNGACELGNAAMACGTLGEACQNCSTAGFESCDPARRACVTNMAQCGPTNCTGCCAGTTCVAGGAANECGSGGQACQSCAANGLVCTAQQCAPPTPPSCGPANCAGCCQGSVCMSGTNGAACGEKGGQCQDCGATGATCLSDGGAGGMCGAEACDSVSCPNGCCDANLTCQPGTSLGACGVGGNSCEDCSAFGPGRGGFAPFQLICSNQTCVPGPPCTCANGCCDANGACQTGSSNTQCGSPYSFCDDCTLSGSQCSNQQCGAALDAGVCNVETCPSGCCDSFGVCQQGITGLQCGTAGTNCQTCLNSSETCVNQQCASADGGACGPNTCGGCCDAFGNCSQTSSDTQCGFGGRSCVNCAALGGTCSGYGFGGGIGVGVMGGPFGGGGFPGFPFATCELPDGAVPCSQSCQGCCDVSGNCQPGFTNTQCGQVGATCQDCTAGATPSTCDVNVSPRTCTSKQTQCPAPYPSCPTALTETAPARQKVCSTLELESAAAACAGGASTTACGAFFTFEGGSNSSCYNCLQAFAYDFVTQVGTRACVAPYVDAACNHNSACIADCVTESCYPCVDPSSTTACDTQVQTGTCAAYFQADQCVAQALVGAGAVCNPATYQNNFGAWLQAVGAQYCGP